MISSLRFRFSIGFIGLALGPILLMGLLYGVISYNDNIAAASYRQQELAHRIGIEAGVILQRLQTELRQAAEHPDFTSVEPGRRDNLLNSLLVSSKTFTELAVVDSMGRETLRLLSTRLNITRDLRFRGEEEAFLIPRERQRLYTGSVFFDQETGEPLITVAYPLIELYSNKFQGVLIGVGRLKSLWELIQQNNTSAGDDIYMLDGTGRVIAHKNPSIVLRGSSFVVQGGDRVQSGLSGKPMVIGSYELSFGEQPFHVIAERSARVALDPAITALQLLLVVLMGSAAVAAVLIYLAIRHVIEPVHKLSTTARAISNGDLSKQAAVEWDDEIGELAMAFNSMSTSLAQSMHSLEESESLYRLLVENQNDLIVKFDAAGRLRFVSQTYCDTFGRSSAELLGQTFVPLIHEEDRAAVQTSLQKLRHPPYTTSHEERAMTTDGYRWFAWSARGVLDESGELKEIISVGRDVTEQKQLEAERHEIEVQLRQAQKMEAIGQLTGGIAHDFNNILASMLGYTYMAMEMYASREDLQPLARYLNEINKSGERARDLVSQMLTFSRGQTGELVPLALKPLVGEDIKMLRSIIPSSIDISVECEPNLPQIMIDPIQLHQVIMNLCINARDAIGQKGEITLGLQRTSPDGQTCQACDALIAGEYVELSVSDTGSGIPDENLERIFEPFFTTKDIGKGTGMGLHTVSGIIHEAGGHLLVNSRVGEGTTFRMLFPVSVEAELGQELSPLMPAQAVNAGGERGTILAVDDEATIANLLRELLTSSGYQVVTVMSGGEAMELLNGQESKFDLLISDQNMPGMSGVELARRVFERQPSLPVILNTGDSSGIDQSELEQTNVKEIMQKPIQLRELLKVVQQYI